MTPRRHNKITTAISLRRRETAARAAQDVGAGSGGERARLEAHIAELTAANRRLQLANASLQRRLDDAECGEGGLRSLER
jgi:hypothetical protein